MRRNRSAEITEIVFAVVIILLCIVLFFFHEEYPILFTAVFAAASLNCLFKAYEGLRYGENRKEKSTRGILFGILTVVLAGVAYVSVMVSL